MADETTEQKHTISLKDLTKANKKQKGTLGDQQSEIEAQIDISKARRATIEGLIDVSGDLKVAEKDQLTTKEAVKDQVKGAGMSIVQGAEGFVTDIFGGPIGGLINTLSMGFLTRWLTNRKQQKKEERDREKKGEEEDRLTQKRIDAMAEVALKEELIVDTKDKEYEAQQKRLQKIKDNIKEEFGRRETQELADTKLIKEKKTQAFLEGKSTEEIAAIGIEKQEKNGGEVVSVEGAAGGDGEVVSVEGAAGGDGGAGGEEDLLSIQAGTVNLQTGAVAEAAGGVEAAGGEVVSTPGFLMSAEDKVDASFAARDGDEVSGKVSLEKEGTGLFSSDAFVDVLHRIAEFTQISSEHLAFMVGNQESAEERRERLRDRGGEDAVAAEDGGKEKKDGKGLLGDFKFGNLFKKGGIKKLIATLATTFGSGLSTAFASVGKTFLTTLGPQLLKFAGPLALIAGLALAVKDGIAGYFMADEWGVSKTSAVMGSVLGGTGSGFKNAFANAGKWALIGVGIGMIGGPPGMIIGGIIGAVIGGILGFIGGENLAKGFDAVGEWFVGIFDTVVDAISAVWHAIMPKWFTDIDFAWTDIFPTALVKLFKGEYFTVDVPSFHWYSLFPNFLVEWFKGTAKKISDKPWSWTDIFPKFLVDFFSGAVAKKEYKFSWTDLFPTWLVNIFSSVGEAFSETPFHWYSLFPDWLVELFKGVEVTGGTEAWKWTDLFPGWLTKIITAGKVAGTTETGEFDWTLLLPSWMGAAWDSTKAMAVSAFNWASLLPGWLSAAWGDAKATGKSMAEGTFDWKALLPTWLHGAFDSSVALKEMAKGFDWTRLLPDWMASAWDTAKKSEVGKGLESLWVMIKGIFSGLIDKVIALLPGAETVKEVTEAVTETIEGTKQLASDIIEDPGGMAKKGFSAVKEGIGSLLSFGDDDDKTSEGIIKAARGAIVTKPAYLPSSGTVVGEHASWSGKGAARGAVGGPIPDGGAEAVIPLEGQRGGSILAEALAPAIAGAILNELAMAMVGGGTEGAGAPTVIQDNSTNQVTNNNTTVTPPQTRGQILPGQGRDHGVLHFTHAA